MTIDVAEKVFVHIFIFQQDLFSSNLEWSISMAVVEIEVEAMLVVVTIVEISFTASSVVVGRDWDDISLLEAIV